MQYSVDEDEWSTRVADRLRMVQSSCADMPAEERRAHVREELTHALDTLKNLPEGDRKVYLEAVLKRFPSWTSDWLSSEAERAAAPANASPREAADNLAGVAHQLNDEERREIAKQLRDAGFDLGAAESGSAPEEGRLSDEILRSLAAPRNEREDAALQRLVDDLRRHFGIEKGEPIDLVRAIKLLSRLMKSYELLDKVAWQAWKQMVRGQSHSAVRRDRGLKGDYRQMAANYLVGEEEPNSSEMGAFLEKTRCLLAGMIYGIGVGGQQFAGDFCRKFHPDQIVDYVRQETKKGVFRTEEARCWDKYRQLMQEKTEAVIEEELHDAIADSILNSFHSLQGTD